MSCIASHPLFPLWADWIHECWDGLDSDDSPTSQQGQNSTVSECLLSALCWLSFCLSSQMCHSVNDWCLPVGLDSSVTCNLPHSCSVSTDPHAWTHSSAHHNTSSSEAMWGLESPRADVSHGSVSSWIISHPVFFSLLSFFLCVVFYFFVDWAKI